MDYIMYLPDGTETISTESFIDSYSEIYFKDYAKNDKEREDDILRIIKKGRAIEPAEVITLMRWKTGDNNADGDIVNCFGKHISLDIGQKVVNAVNSDMGQDEMSMYQTLLSRQMSGLGTVYLLTLVWAISGMKYPIYDKYADIAISAICENKRPDEIRDKYKQPPDKTQIKQVMEMYKQYQFQLTKVFGDGWKTRREIDQALWTYGHQKGTTWKR